PFWISLSATLVLAGATGLLIVGTAGAADGSKTSVETADGSSPTAVVKELVAPENLKEGKTGAKVTEQRSGPTENWFGCQPGAKAGSDTGCVATDDTVNTDTTASTDTNEKGAAVQ
ncbi:MAG: hypothetical protein AAGJ53_06385, partial [Pseudomonadota bacterium]